MKSRAQYKGRTYSTQNRTYCLECSPPRNATSDATSSATLDATSKKLHDKAETETASDDAARHRPRFILGTLAGEPRWIHGVDDLEERLPNCYKFCERCNFAYTYSIEMVKERIFKRGTTIPEYVIRYCEDCYEKVSAEKFAKKIATKISQTSYCRKCKISHHTYIPYSSLLKCRVTKSGQDFDMICLSCEDDYNNDFIREVDEANEDDINVSIEF
jgi:hypothetical protein